MLSQSGYTNLEEEKFAIITKVIGIGKAGINAVNNMIESSLKGVTFIAIDTDKQVLKKSKADVKIQIEELAKDLRIKVTFQVGSESNLKDNDIIKKTLKGSDMVFITAGFGGKTGTNAVLAIAKIAKELKALTIAVITKPFSFEGKEKSNIANNGIEKLKNIADMVIIIPNNKLKEIVQNNTTQIELLKKADEIMHHSVRCITDLFMEPGLVAIDFDDVKIITTKAGIAFMGMGMASGKNKAEEAAKKVISNILFDDLSIKNYKAIIIHMTTTSDVSLDEMTEASDIIYEMAGDDAEIWWGQTTDESFNDEMMITLIVIPV